MNAEIHQRFPVPESSISLETKRKLAEFSQYDIELGIKVIETIRHSVNVLSRSEYKDEGGYTAFLDLLECTGLSEEEIKANLSAGRAQVKRAKIARRRVSSDVLSSLHDRDLGNLSFEQIETGIKAAFVLERADFEDRMKLNPHAETEHSRQRDSNYRILLSLRGQAKYKKELNVVKDYYRQHQDEGVVRSLQTDFASVHTNYLIAESFFENLELERLKKSNAAMQEHEFDLKLDKVGAVITNRTNDLRQKIQAGLWGVVPIQEKSKVEKVITWLKDKKERFDNSFFNKRVVRIAGATLLIIGSAACVALELAQKTARAFSENIEFSSGVSEEAVNKILETINDENENLGKAPAQPTIGPTETNQIQRPTLILPKNQVIIQPKATEIVNSIISQPEDDDSTLYESHLRPHSSVNQDIVVEATPASTDTQQASPADITSTVPVNDSKDVEATSIPNPEPTKVLENSPQVQNKETIEIIKNAIFKYNEGLSVPEELRHNTAVFYIAISGTEGEIDTNTFDSYNPEGVREYHTDANIAIVVKVEDNTVKINLLIPFTRDMVTPYKLDDGRRAKIKELHWFFGSETWEKEMERMTGIDGRSQILSSSTFIDMVGALFPEGIEVNNPVDFTSFAGFHFPKGKIVLGGNRLWHYIAERKAFSNEAAGSQKNLGYPTDVGLVYGDEARAQKGLDVIKQLVLKNLLAKPGRLKKLPEAIDLLKLDPFVLNVLSQIDMLNVLQGIVQGSTNIQISTVTSIDLDHTSQTVLGHPWFSASWRDGHFLLNEDSGMPDYAVGPYRGDECIDDPERYYSDVRRLLLALIKSL